MVDDRIAESCDQQFCICTSHEDYDELVAHRVENSQNSLLKPTYVDEEEEVEGDEIEDEVPAGEVVEI